MLGFLARWAESWAESAARAMLARLPERIGLPDRAAPGPAAPGLLAVIDQHAAAVRDILDVGVPGSAAVARPVLLAGYARGLLDQAREQGWHPAPDPGAHPGVDWLTARLWAVCDLALHLDDPPPPVPAL
jgi:hypothetical protein